jgi:hypothetical protein
MVLVVKPESKNHLEDPGVDGRIFRKWDVGVWTGSSWLRIGISEKADKWVDNGFVMICDIFAF